MRHLLSCSEGHRWEVDVSCPHCQVHAAAEQATLPHLAAVTGEVATLAPAPREPAALSLTGELLHIPGYHVFKELGRGGMGVVYKAQQLGLDRPVALKMILAGCLAGSMERARFQLEAEAVARLKHPNIVEIYAVGEHAGQPFFALEFVDGCTLSKKLDHKPQPAQQAARMVRQLALAAQAAHEKGIVHRDLKPANVLVAADGTLKVTDFGLAKRLDAETVLTQTDAIVGTPSYMAPEQASGEPRAVGPAADVYALGAILYEMLTGRPPFLAETPLDTIFQLVSEEPVPPSRFHAKVSPDLEAVCLKCLQKQPRKRYLNAQALADDLDRFLQGRPTSVAPSASSDSLTAWLWFVACLAVWLSGTSIAGLIVMMAVASFHSLPAVALFFLGGLLVYFFVVVYQAANWCYLRSAPDASNTLNGHRGQVRALAFAPDGKRLASAGNDGNVRIWDLVTNQVWANLSGHSGKVLGVVFSPDGKELFSIGADGTVRRWDAINGRALGTLHKEFNQVNAVALSPDGRTLAWGGERGAVKLWDVEAGKLSGELVRRIGGAPPIATLAFSPDGHALASGHAVGETLLWDLSRRELRIALTFSSRPVVIAFRPDGRVLATTAEKLVLGRTVNGVQFWNVVTATPFGSLSFRSSWTNPWQTLRNLVQNRGPSRGPVHCLAFSPDGKILAVGRGRIVQLWDVAGEKLSNQFSGHRRAVNALAYAPDGQTLASGSADQTVRLWDPSARPRTAR